MNKEMNEAQFKETADIINGAKDIVSKNPDREFYLYMAYLMDANKLVTNICDLTGTKEAFGKDVSDSIFFAEVIKSISAATRESEFLKPDSPVFVIFFKTLAEISLMEPQDMHNIICDAFSTPANVPGSDTEQ